MDENKVSQMKELMALDETKFKQLYQGLFVSVDMGSKQEDDRTVLVVAHNYRQFQTMR